MTPLEAALSAWLAFHSELGVDMEALLMPPATDAQIVAVEEVIGYRLPEDLRELYKIANGQWDRYRDDAPLTVDRTQRWAPLFGYYIFLSLDDALQRYASALDAYNLDNEFNTKYYAANPDEIYDPMVWIVREGDAVDEAGWNPKWFSFTDSSDVDNYFVDMNPTRGGIPGQIISRGEETLHVVGHSVTDLMEQAVFHLSVDDEHRYEYSDGEHSAMPSLFFDMDWRNEPIAPPSEESTTVSSAYAQWKEEQDRMQAIQREQLMSWLDGRGMQAVERDSIVRFTRLRLNETHFAVPPIGVTVGMPNLGEMVGKLAEFISLRKNVGVLQDYAMILASTYINGDSMASSIGLTTSVDEAIDLYHLFKLESGAWSQSDFDKVGSFLAKLREIPINAENGFSMDMDGSILTICHSTFDEETYKSDEVCYTLDLNRF